MEISLTIDGIPLTVPAGTSIIEAAKMAGIEIPHFCYHEKLSIAANCRMCLVEVEKAPKPLPACATSVAADMVVRTCSEKAKAAQQGVMEFLLINHPLDCPICDQGGECQLQDLSVGYGMSNSRYTEPKRVVVEKNLGPLISTDMMRCIHCTRCVRVGQEVAGVMELGMISRGEHVEIMPFVEKTVDSELSGNMIDVCPVGALTSKPFRFSARVWEMKDRPGVSPHDSWGSNLRIQVKGKKVKRVLPRANEQINECWISDRDRFSYEGLYDEGRAVEPLLRLPGAKHTASADWQDALDHVTERLRSIVRQHGPGQVGFLAKNNMTLEELYLLQKLGRGLGSANLDCRLYQRDFSMDGDEGAAIPWFGMPISAIADVRQVLLIGLNPGNEVPLFGHKLRQMRRLNRSRIGSVGQIDVSSQVKTDFAAVVPPGGMVPALARILKACGGPDLPGIPPCKEGEIDEERLAKFVSSMNSKEQSAVWIGQQAMYHPHYGLIRKLATAIADRTDSKLGVKNPGSNSIGAYLAGMCPGRGVMHKHVHEDGLNARRMIETPLKAYVLLGCEPEDCFDPRSFERAMGGAEFVTSIGCYASPAQRYSQAVLPAAPFSETDGTFVNTEGQPQTFPAAVPPLGQARPAWKILCALGMRLGLQGFDFENLAQVRKEIVSQGADFTESLGVRCDYGDLEGVTYVPPEEGGALERIYEVASYATDPVVRRSEPLQKTVRSKRSRMVNLNPDTAARLGLAQGDPVRISAKDSCVDSALNIDPNLAKGCVRIPIGVPEFSEIGGAEMLHIESAALERAAEG